LDEKLGFLKLVRIIWNKHLTSQKLNINLLRLKKAFNSLGKEFIGKDIFETVLTTEQSALIGESIKENISVDRAWNTATLIVEIQLISERNNSDICPNNILIEFGSEHKDRFKCIKRPTKGRCY
jgi:hypothetical protein